MIYVPTNKKGNKLKDSIKYLEVKLQLKKIAITKKYILFYNLTLN